MHLDKVIMKWYVNKSNEKSTVQPTPRGIRTELITPKSGEGKEGIKPESRKWMNKYMIVGRRP